MASYWDLPSPPPPGQPFVPWLPDPGLLGYYYASAAPTAPQVAASSKASTAPLVKQSGGESDTANLYPFPPSAGPAVSPPTSAPQQAFDQERALERAMLPRPRPPTSTEAIGLPSRESWWMNALDVVDPYLAADIRSGKLREMFTSPQRELAQNTGNAAVESNQLFLHGLSETLHGRTTSGAAQAVGGLWGFVGSPLAGASTTLGDEVTKWTGNPDFGRKVGILAPLFSSPSAAARPGMASSNAFIGANGAKPLNLAPQDKSPQNAILGFGTRLPNTAPSAAANVPQYAPRQVAAPRSILRSSRQSGARPPTPEEDNSRMLYDKDRDLLQLIDPGNAELQTSRPADWIPSIQDRQMLNDQISILRERRRFLRDLENHHNFPQGDEFARMFDTVGINVDDYRNYMWAWDHRDLHTGPDNWISQWRAFQRENQNPTLDMIHKQLNKMLTRPREP